MKLSLKESITIQMKKAINKRTWTYELSSIK